MIPFLHVTFINREGYKTFMRNLLTIIFLTLSFNCLGQNDSQQLIEQTAQKVGIQTADVFSRHATFQKFGNGTLIVIPEIAEQGDGYLIFNSNIILLDDKTGEVKAQFSCQKDWYIDAVSIDQIEIEYMPYQLNETTVAFGIKIFYSNQSQAHPHSSIRLSLYALERNKLNFVLKDFPIMTFTGESDTTCKGTFVESSKKMQILKTHTNGFADLKFTNNLELGDQNNDCKKIIEETKSEVEILSYQHGAYKINL